MASGWGPELPSSDLVAAAMTVVVSNGLTTFALGVAFGFGFGVGAGAGGSVGVSGAPVRPVDEAASERNPLPGAEGANKELATPGQHETCIAALIKELHHLICGAGYGIEPHVHHTN